MDEYSYVKAGVLSAIEEIRGATRKIDQDLNLLESQTAVHLNEWIGQAKEQYGIERANWDRALVEMNQVLDKAGLTLDDILREYDTTEARARDAWTVTT